MTLTVAAFALDFQFCQFSLRVWNFDAHWNEEAQLGLKVASSFSSACLL